MKYQNYSNNKYFKGNFILDFVDGMANKNKKEKTIYEEFTKEAQRKTNEIYKRFENNNYSIPPLSERFQNIHIAQLAKLAKEDKRKKTNDNEAKTFNFWHFFQGKY